jgi:hypothetical protein
MVLRQRNRLMTSVVRQLQDVVAALQLTHGREYRTSFRMADFATFVLRLAHAERKRSTGSSRITRMKSAATSPASPAITEAF